MKNRASSVLSDVVINLSVGNRQDEEANVHADGK